MAEKIHKVKCSFCGKEIECPEDMLKAEKHACFECFSKMEDSALEDDPYKLHVDIPKEEAAASLMIQYLVDNDFRNMWSKDKNELKDLSKKDLAMEMYSQGAAAMLELMTTKLGEFEKELKRYTEEMEKEANNG